MAQLRSHKHSRILPKILIVLAVVFVVCLYVSFSAPAGFVISESQESETASTRLAATSDKAASVVVVHVDGGVVVPGVYELEEGKRVRDAIECAGGLTSEADTTSINLAALLVDAQKIYVPLQGESEHASSGVTSTNSSGTSLININTATAEELDTLPGVGSSTAATIIQDREKSGPFTSIEDIMRISGIGEKKFEKIKDYICV